MSRALPAPPLLVITDRAQAGDVIAVCEAAFRGGCRWLMLREKDLDTIALAELAARLLAAARPCGACILVNGDVAAAGAAGVDGVHLPQGASVAAARGSLGGSALIGVSAHSEDEARAAQRAGADYVTLSPVFATASKPGYGPALGTDGLARIVRTLSIPALALAGVNAANAPDCLAAGAAGVAVMGGVMSAADPERAVREIIAAIGS